MKVSRWRRRQWDRQAKRQSETAVTVNLVWPGVTAEPLTVSDGNTLTVDGVFTLVVTGPRAVRISPPMTSEELRAETEREIRAKYGLRPAVGG